MVLHVPILYTENTPCPGFLRFSRDANDIIFIILFITLWVIKHYHTHTGITIP